MKPSIALFVAVGISGLVTAAAFAQDKSGAAAPDKNEAVRELLQLTGSANLGKQVMAQMIPELRKAMPDIPDSFWTDFMAEVKTAELVVLVVGGEQHLAG